MILVAQTMPNRDFLDVCFCLGSTVCDSVQMQQHTIVPCCQSSVNNIPRLLCVSLISGGLTFNL